MIVSRITVTIGTEDRVRIVTGDHIGNFNVKLEIESIDESTIELSGENTLRRMYEALDARYGKDGNATPMLPLTTDVQRAIDKIFDFVMDKNDEKASDQIATLRTAGLNAIRKTGKR